jgi:excisionase family DNA binding protein
MYTENFQRRVSDRNFVGKETMDSRIEHLNQKKIFTVGEAAQYLTVHKDTLYDMLHTPDGDDNDFPHFHVGKGDRTIRIFRDLLDLWVIENNKGIKNQELIAFRKAYMNNIGRNVIEPQSSEVTHGQSLSQWK